MATEQVEKANLLTVSLYRLLQSQNRMIQF